MTRDQQKRKWPEPLFDRAPVRVKFNGGAYVRVEDLIRSRKFQETCDRLEKMIEEHPLPWTIYD